MGFICAFIGRRDAYQVAVALAEVGQLDRLVTDFYSGTSVELLGGYLPQSMGRKIHSRRHPDLPSKLVKSCYTYLALGILATAAKVEPNRRFSWFDPLYGKEAAKLARRYRSDLFIYSPYAWEAFLAEYDHAPRKILFQFHPHHEYESNILAIDRAEYSKLNLAFSEDIDSTPDLKLGTRQKSDSAWKYADHIVCASTFSKLSLTKAGASADRISVIPYGIDSALISLQKPIIPQYDHFHVLYVGTGLQRKGLHHLLLAWRKARLPSGAVLTVVARSYDPVFERLFQETPGVQLLKGVGAERLAQLYGSATLFAMPSLIEGFGQVYLEALKSGLPVLGTVNTGLPDLGAERDGIFVVSPGNVEELTEKLEVLSKLLPGNVALRQAAIECANRFTWERFRREIQLVAGAEFSH